MSIIKNKYIVILFRANEEFVMTDEMYECMPSTSTPKENNFKNKLTK